jgi:hypothetical protein
MTILEFYEHESKPSGRLALLRRHAYSPVMMRLAALSVFIA